MHSAVKKRSLVIRGHRTSISLEDEFWDALRDIAEERNLAIHALVEQIDVERRSVNLSSAIRVFVFKHYLAAAKLA